MIPEVSALLVELTDGVREALGDNLLGIYTRGSLALGDFNAETSDVDVLMATERPVSEAEFAALAAFHEALGGSGMRYARELEVAYLHRCALARFRPREKHPTLYRWYQTESTFRWSEHGINWLFERWTVREHGVALVGPDPKQLIDPIRPEELREAARLRLQDWAAFADDLTDPEWCLRRHHAYAVETMCRALHTVSTGEIVGKLRAVARAETWVPERWLALLARTREWRVDDGRDEAPEAEVLVFVKWAAEWGIAGDGAS